MAIHGVDTKCYILALFVRNDGERFLLGSGHYEFKDTQMHFAANAIQNDIVEVQGNDGFLLAGQVRRPGTQSFDGYVGDGTLSKQDTEAYRRLFFSFFRKNFFYKVIYVFSDDTAIQRKRGFLVDDPTVQELYQIYPEYHVALNFEDVNYYSYSEDDEGHEQYAEEATIDLSSMRATGGLEWDNLGVIWEAMQWGGEQSVSGTELTIQNNLDIMVPTKDEKIEGDAQQKSYSGKNLVNIHGTLSERNVTTTISGENITVVSSNSADTARVEVPVSYVANQQVTISFDATCNVYQPSTPNLAIVYMRVGNTSATRINLPTSSGVTTHYEVAFTPTVDGMSLWLYVKSSPVSGITSYRFSNIQIEAGSTATDYEPYVGGVPAPNPDYPQTVQTVTGEQTVTVSDDTNSQSYTVNLGTTELCKLGDYQDYIYKGTDGWYVHKEIGKVVFNGTETWGQVNSYAYFSTTINTDLIKPSNIYSLPLILSNYYSPASRSNLYDSTVDYGIGIHENTPNRILIRNKDYTSIPAFTTWLSNHNMTVYYPLATSSDTKITDATLISQLNRLGSMKLFVGENNLSVLPTGTNLPAPLSFKYYTTVEATGAGAIWEEGGSGGATVVEVDSITNVYPIWKVKGPVINPELSVITTNTTLQYNGTITGTQTLEVDMFNKTAKLNGVSVIGNISGDWVNFLPGTNRVIYTADNADALPSTIEWQEVVG